MASMPDMFEAGVLEAGQTCPRCQSAIRRGQRVGRCPDCQHLQHEGCWLQAGRCLSYQCAQDGTRPRAGRRAEIVITAHDVSRAGDPMLPGRVVIPVGWDEAPTPTRYSGLAVAALIISCLAIVFFGVPGLLGAALGIVAIGATNTRRDLRGSGLAVAAILIGVLATVCWIGGAVLFLNSRQSRQERRLLPGAAPQTTHIAMEDLDGVPPGVRRAIRANVLVKATSSGGFTEGSGVVIETKGRKASIITNRHVVDGQAGLLNGRRDLQVTFCSGQQREASVVWRGPDGLDIAVLECEFPEGEGVAVPLRQSPRLTIGEDVFAIGNPIGLGWSYGSGVISAVRRLALDDRALRLIQAQVPLNPGNSGGGLYDSGGVLIGINTMTADQRLAEGIGFAIAVADIVPLLESGAGLRVIKAEAASGLAGGERP